jgi:hypothetical protein
MLHTHTHAHEHTYTHTATSPNSRRPHVSAVHVDEGIPLRLALALRQLPVLPLLLLLLLLLQLLLPAPVGGRAPRPGLLRPVAAAAAAAASGGHLVRPLHLLPLLLQLPLGQLRGARAWRGWPWCSTGRDRGRQRTGRALAPHRGGCDGQACSLVRGYDRLVYLPCPSSLVPHKGRAGNQTI